MSARQAESLPFEDDVFDAALAQLVVHFMADPVGGLREMRRVTKASGVVAACVWDHAGGHGPLGVFWEAARVLDVDVDDESSRAGARAGHLAELFEAAGLRDVEEGAVSVTLEHRSFDEWWEPFTLGMVRPARLSRAWARANSTNCVTCAENGYLPRAPGLDRPAAAHLVFAKTAPRCLQAAF